MRSRVAAAAFAAALFATAPAWADHAEAVKLFDDGRKLRDEGKFDKAVRAFQQSIAAEPSIGAYYNLGLANEQLGKLREAADAYKKSRTLAHERGDAREKEAVDALSKLLETHNHVRLEVDEKTAGMPGLRVVLDGEVVPPSTLNGEIFRTPETHEVLVTAFGHKDVKTTLKNRQAFPITVGDPVGESGTGAPPPPPTTPETSTGGWGWQKWTGVGLMGAGVGAAVIGILFVLDFRSTQTDIQNSYRTDCAKGACGTGKPMFQRGQDLQTQADDLATSSAIRHSVAFGSAGLLMAGGIYLFLTAPSSHASEQTPSTARVRVVPHVSPHDGSLEVVGTF